MHAPGYAQFGASTWPVNSFGAWKGTMMWTGEVARARSLGKHEHNACAIIKDLRAGQPCITKFRSVRLSWMGDRIATWLDVLLQESSWSFAYVVPARTLFGDR